MPTQLHEVVLDDDVDVDLSRFESLTEDEKVRVIIRVLCGLVALEERGGAPEVPDARNPVVRRLLPFLGFEGRQAIGRDPRPAERRGRLPVLGVSPDVTGGLHR
ncbi:MAG: hypothetical protein U5R31_13595 [Acidimicrobiia bacterium]|nr:hypothetical protein [Acidimicrobiia bacterium]